jgi:uncharacterized Zn finger protein
MTATLQAAFGPSALCSLATGRSFERGAAYAAEGRVKKLKVGVEEAVATVRGTRAYEVRLWLAGGAPDFSCTCPVAADGLFCKHCVAVGLVLSQVGAGAAQQGAPAAIDLRAHLEGLDKSRLVDLVLEQAERDELLQERLLLEAAKAQGARLDLGGYRTAIDDAMDPGDYVDYRAMYDYASGVEDLIGSLRDLFDAGYALEVVELCEHALARLDEAIEHLDDSNGETSDIRESLCDLHHAACLKARPEPVALAERLFETELHSEWDTFFGAAATYADVLGEPGLAAYRRRAEEEWEQIAALGPGEEGGHSSFRFSITHIMETLAGLSADPDLLVAVLAHDLSSAYGFVRIAETYREAGRHDEALAWAERGVATFPEHTDVRLREILADEYQRRGRHEEAMDLMWAAFTEQPALAGYQRLKTHATAAGAWDSWRARALDLMRQSAAAAAEDVLGSNRWGRPADRSALVKALLWEGDVEAAWQEAVAGGCDDSLWMELAARREAGHPEDVLPIYQRQIEQLIDVKKNHTYAAAVALLHRVKKLLDRLDRGSEFAAYLAAVRAAHKPKRNLMKLLDEARW